MAAVPVPDRFDLQQAVDEARADGRGMLHLPAGRLLLAGGVVLEHCRGLTICGAEAGTVLLSDVSMEGTTTITVRDCEDIVFRDFVLDCDPLPFTQGTVADVRTGADRSVDFEIHKGYAPLGQTSRSDRLSGPSSGMVGAYFFVDGTTGRQKTSLHFLLSGMLDDADGMRGELPTPWSNVVPGDVVVVEYRANGGSAFGLTTSRDVRIEDVTIHASASGGVGARMMRGGHNYFRYRVVPGPRPPGADRERVISTNADAFNWGSGHGEIVLDGCEFGFMADDAVNIHGTALPIAKVESDHTLWLAAPGGVNLAMGLQWLKDMVEEPEPALVVRYGTFESLEADARIVQFGLEPAADPSDFPGLKEVIAHWVRLGAHAERAGWSFARVEFDRAVGGVSAGDLLVLPRLSPQPFSIRDCYVHDSIGRVVTIASNGIVENNRFERCGVPAILLLNPRAWLLEDGCASDIVVRGNSVREARFGSDDFIPHTYGPGVISVTAPPAGSRYPIRGVALPERYPVQPCIRNVQIVDNHIEDADSAAVFVDRAESVDVAHNLIRRVNQSAGEGVGSLYDYTAPYAVTVVNSRAVDVHDNVIVELGPHALGPVKDLGDYLPE